MGQDGKRFWLAALLAVLLCEFTASPALTAPIVTGESITAPPKKIEQGKAMSKENQEKPLLETYRGPSFRISPGAQFRDCSGCPEMIVVPPGKFTMGSPIDEQGHSDDEEPQHDVIISREFAIGRYEVTFSEWDACVADNGCDHVADDANWGRDSRPVINVSWDDAQAYVKWLSEKTGEKYRLPSEAEWEYAARAGTRTPRFWKNRQVACAFANVFDISAQRVHKLEWQNFVCIDAAQSTAPVGGYLANNFGLHDMLGNVWEWVADCWNPNYYNAPTNGAALYEGDCRRHVMRGGSWQNVDWATRSSFRGWNGAKGRANHIGFRVARSSS